MPKISVITPTIRIDGLKLVENALKKQDMQDFEWLICSKQKPRRIDIPYTWLEDDFKDGVWTLNRAYNKLIKQAQAHLIVSWQDYIYAKFDTLGRFLTHFEQDNTLLVSAVGNKYKTVYPEVGAMVWKDPRERSDQGNYYLTGFENIEWNMCSIPKKALYDIGGFDESMDFLGYGMDGYGVNERIGMLGGYDFAIDQSIKSYSAEHDRPVDWEEKNIINGAYLDKKLEYLQTGPVLTYLK